MRLLLFGGVLMKKNVVLVLFVILVISLPILGYTINNQRNAARSLSTPSHENKFNPNRNPQIYQSNNQANYNYQPNQAVYQQQNNYIKMPSDRIVGQPPTTPGLTYSQNQVLYNQASNQVNNNINQQRPNQNSAAIKQSQEYDTVSVLFNASSTAAE